MESKIYTTELAKTINILREKLLTDNGYKISWIANIAMAYKDNEHWYRKKTGKKYLNNIDKHIIANNAAEYFIKQLINNK